MTDASGFPTPDEVDQLVDQSDNGPEPGQPDPPQDPNWRPWSTGPAGQ